MFNLKKILLASATLIAVETAFISPLQALTFKYKLTSPLQIESSYPSNSGSLLMNGYNPYPFNSSNLIMNNSIPYLSNSGNVELEGWKGVFSENYSYSGNSFSMLGSINWTTASYSGSVNVTRSGYMYSFYGLYSKSSYGIPYFTWKIQFSCQSLNLIDCNNSSGTLWGRFGVSPSNPAYTSAIIVDNFSLSQPAKPPSHNSVPEPSLISAFLLISGSLLLEKKMKNGNSQLG